MKQTIIETAGKAWKLLGQKGQAEVAEIPKLLKEKEEVVLQALGWLAREDKIFYTERDKRNYVSLVREEYEAFKNCCPTEQTVSVASACDMKAKEVKPVNKLTVSRRKTR